MKAANLIKRFGLFGISPVVRIVKRMEPVKEFHTRGRDDLEEIVEYCELYNFTVTSFIVEHNTLTINVA